MMCALLRVDNRDTSRTMRSFLPLIKSEWRLLLFGFVMTFGSSLGQTYFIALFSGQIRADLGISHGTFGAIYSGATLASAVLLLWTGTLIDRMDLRRFAYMSVLGLALGCLILAGSQGTITLFIAILVLRHMGQGLMSMAGVTSIVRYIDHQRGKANAISGIGFSFSEAVLPSAIIALLAVLGWRESWLLSAVILVAVLPLMIYWLLGTHDVRHTRYVERLAADDASESTAVARQWTRNEVIRDPQLYLFMPAMLTQPMLYTGFMFHQVQLVEEKGWSLVVWASLYLLYAMTTIGMKLISGLLVDRFGAIRLVPYLALPLGLGLLLLSTSDSIIIAVLFMFLMGIGVGNYSTLSSPFYAEMYGTLHLGSIKSVTTAAMVFASAIAPVIMGWMIDSGVSMDVMALMGVAYVVLATMLAWLGYRLKTHK
ncbi:MAG: MFS transporter [Halioglobus sp.]